MTLLVLIRHGPTEWNAARRLQGRSDIPLSAAGRASVHAWTVPDEFQTFHWVSSPLRRTVETATLLLGTAPPTDPRLVEMSFGEWEGRTLADLRAELGAEVAEREARGLDFQAPDGESPRQVQDRVRPFLDEVAGGGRPAVAVTHKGVLRAVYAAAANWDMLGKPPEKLKDACAHVFELAGDGAPAVHQLNIPLEA
jgi:broad specificity phosphatase PhoE